MQTLYALRAFDGIERLSSQHRQRRPRNEAEARLARINFGSRVIVERLSCGTGIGRSSRVARTRGSRTTQHGLGRQWTAVRMLVDEAVVRMPFCDSDRLGLCELETFLQGLTTRRRAMWPEGHAG